MRTCHSWVLVLVGCGVDSPSPIVAPPLVPYEAQCRSLECGNSPEVARNGMHEASLFGVPDEHGIFLEVGPSGRAQIWSDAGEAYDLYIEDDRIVGRYGKRVMRGDQLKGAKMHVWQADQQIYTIWFDGSPRLVTMAEDSELVEVYPMRWLALGKPPEELCNVPMYPIPKDQHIGMKSGDVLVILGDRVKSVEKEMSTDEEWDPTWFNFGCAGRTLAKLKLTRNTTLSQLRTTERWEHRQATLKMLAGDYLGTGRPFTVTGVPILWNDNFYIQYAGLVPSDIEARWTWRGAMCINGIRIERTTLPEAQTELADLYAQGLIMSCYDQAAFPQGLYNFSGTDVISAYLP